LTPFEQASSSYYGERVRTSIFVANPSPLVPTFLKPPSVRVPSGLFPIAITFGLSVSRGLTQPT
jgi:hypothetical protein